jgi:Lysyl oxidase/von Willebrand factor type A domain
LHKLRIGRKPVYRVGKQKIKTMGVDLIPIVRNFFIRNEVADAHSIQDGCVTAGTHRVMRFDFLSHNIGTEDFVVGAPSSHPEWFTESASHGHFHLKDFNEFILYDINGVQVTKGYKQAFCTIDIEHLSPWGPVTKQFTDCNINQGISAGWADVYNSCLPCQFIVIDGIPDGDYTLVSTTNSKHIIPEDTYDNNTICTGLRISGDAVDIIDPCTGLQITTDSVVAIDPPLKIEMATPSIDFNDVPERETTVRAVTLRVTGCREVHFEIIDGPKRLTGPLTTTFGTPAGISASVPHTHRPDKRSAYLWISFSGTADGDVATGQVTVKCTETNEQWIVPIHTNTVKRKTVAVELVLDKSGSMTFNSGFTIPFLDTRIKVLHYAALPLTDVIQEANGIGVCSFDQNAYPVVPVTVAGPLIFGAGRNNAKTAILNHQPNPMGTTAIGDGVVQGMNDLAAAGIYDVKAMIVLTDGFDTDHLAVSEVAGLLNNTHVFAIGLGNEANIKPAALDALTNSTGGYLLLSGNMNNDDQFLLNKYFLQILAGITNTDIATDPEGTLHPGDEHIIPFNINEADITSDIVLLSPAPGLIEFLLKTPGGDIIHPAMAGTVAGVQFSGGINSAFYRITFPVPLGTAGGAGEGQWQAILRMKAGQHPGNYYTHIDRSGQSFGSIRYSLNVYSYSNLKMSARAFQNSYQPGAEITIRAVLAQYGLPLDDVYSINAEIKYPDNTVNTVALTKAAAGIFECSFKAGMQGVYKIHLVAQGRTLRGRLFTREQLLTASVYQGGDTPVVIPGDDNSKHAWCDFLKCLTEHKVLSREFLSRMEEIGINWKALEKCLCKK